MIFLIDRTFGGLDFEKGLRHSFLISLLKNEKRRLLR